MSKLKGIKDMSAEVIKSKSGEVAEPKVVREKKEKRPKRHNRVGYGRYKPTVVMSNLKGEFVFVKRELVLDHLELGWKTVKRQAYRKAMADGSGVVVEKVKEIPMNRKQRLKAKEIFDAVGNPGQVGN